MRDKYMLRGHEVVAEPDLMTWANWFETADRRVAWTDLPGGVQVSTVFLGLDHNFGMGSSPSLFETMIFNGPHDQYQERYSTWAEAEDGHRRAVAMARETDAPMPVGSLQNQKLFPEQP